jgi:hypothetical protein
LQVVVDEGAAVSCASTKGLTRNAMKMALKTMVADMGKILRQECSAEKA